MGSRARPGSPGRVAQGPPSRPARWAAGAARVTAAAGRRGPWVFRRKAREEDAVEDEPASTSRAEEPKITAGGLAELIGFGLGLPVPASVELDKENWKVGSGAPRALPLPQGEASVTRGLTPGSAQVNAEFEANNFGIEQKYRDEGYVPSADEGGQGFNFLGLLWLPVVAGLGYGIYATLQALS